MTDLDVLDIQIAQTEHLIAFLESALVEIPADIVPTSGTLTPSPRLQEFIIETHATLDSLYDRRHEFTSTCSVGHLSQQRPTNWVMCSSEA